MSKVDELAVREEEVADADDLTREPDLPGAETDESGGAADDSGEPVSDRVEYTELDMADPIDGQQKDPMIVDGHESEDNADIALTDEGSGEAWNKINVATLMCAENESVIEDAVPPPPTEEAIENDSNEMVGDDENGGHDENTGDRERFEEGGEDHEDLDHDISAPFVEVKGSASVVDIPTQLPSDGVTTRANEDDDLDNDSMAPPSTSGNGEGVTSDDDEAWQTVSKPGDEEVDGSTPAMPPPSPAVISAQPTITGCMYAVDGVGDDSEEDEDEDRENGEAPRPTTPLRLGCDDDDDDDELEIDLAVAEQIGTAEKLRETAKQNATATAEIPPEENPLLDVLNSSAKHIGAMATDSGSKKQDLNEIAMAFGSDELRVAHAVVPSPPLGVTAKDMPAVVSTDSSEAVFGIGYRSMRKSSDITRNNGTEAYTMSSESNFHEFEQELTLDSDLSYSVQGKRRSKKAEAASVTEASEQIVDSVGSEVENDTNDDEDEDEFGSILEGGGDKSNSPTRRISQLLEKVQSSVQSEDDVLEEVKRATDEERQRLAAEAAGDAEATRRNIAHAGSEIRTDENAITLKELHSIYKRGLGDQEVRMLDQDDGATGCKPNSSAPCTAGSNAIPTAKAGKPTVINQAIEEEEEEDQSGADGGATNPDEDTEDENGEDGIRYISASAGGEDGDVGGEWKEVHLLRKMSSPQLLEATSVMPSSPNEMQSPREAITPVVSPTGSSISKIGYTDALRHFMESEDVMQHRPQIVTESFAKSRSCLSCLFRLPRLTFSGAIEQRDRVFCIAATPFNPTDSVSVSILQTLYRKITKTQRDVSLIGPHWERIGFQGTDPSTDLRGCGMLSLLQMLHLVDSHAELTQRFFTLAQHPVRHFPMACVLINVTLHCLTNLRSGVLYRECNKHSSVFVGMNSLFVALTMELMHELQTSSQEVPLVMKQVFDDCHQHPDALIERHARLSLALSSSPSSTSPRNLTAVTSSAKRSGQAPPHPEFTEIALHSVSDD